MHLPQAREKSSSLLGVSTIAAEMLVPPHFGLSARLVRVLEPICDLLAVAFECRLEEDTIATGLKLERVPVACRLLEIFQEGF